MPRYDVYIPFTCSYEGEIADEEFSIIVKADNEKDAIQEAFKELESEYVIKTVNSDDITVEQIPEYPSFDDSAEVFVSNLTFVGTGEMNVNIVSWHILTPVNIIS